MSDTWSGRLPRVSAVLQALPFGGSSFGGDETLAPGSWERLCQFSSRAVTRLDELSGRSDGSILWRYGISTFFVTVALITEKILQQFFPYPFLLVFFAAVIASAWCGGALTGIFAVLMSIGLVNYFFIPPLDTFIINAPAVAYCAAFIVTAFLASWVSAVEKKGEESLKDARDQLELRVAERTAQLQLSNAELVRREHQLEHSNAELRERELQLRLLIAERERAEQALMKTQAELAHLSRVLTMGELTTSIAHEVTQPLTAVVINGDTCLECLAAEPPDLQGAREATERVIEDGTRAGAVLRRIRSLFKKEALAKDWLDMNEVIQELTVFLRDEAVRHHISMRTELMMDLPMVKGDRVQLQQVVLNLMMNGMDAMSEKTGGPRELRVASCSRNASEVVIRVEDRGVGFCGETSEKIFDPFFTTKKQGLGMGLSISRSIVESHGGRIWAMPRPEGGATFEFSVPIKPSTGDG